MGLANDLVYGLGTQPLGQGRGWSGEIKKMGLGHGQVMINRCVLYRK